MISTSSLRYLRYHLCKLQLVAAQQQQMSTTSAGYLQEPSAAGTNGTTPVRKPVTIPTLHRMKAAGEPIAMLTAYDYTMAVQVERAGVDVALVGDSLGSVIHGYTNTLPVTLADVLYHTRAVRRALKVPLLVADLPFMCMRDMQSLLDASISLVAEGGAAMVKLEVGGAGRRLHLDMVRALVEHSIPVCAHLGLTPQSVHALGGFRVQGKDASARPAEQLLQDAVSAEEAGADLLVLECVPRDLARDITKRMRIPTIGIGAGVHCDGQVLVPYDALGLSGAPAPKFVKNFLRGRDSVLAALQAYVAEVKGRQFPAEEHTYH